MWSFERMFKNSALQTAEAKEPLVIDLFASSLEMVGGGGNM